MQPVGIDDALVADKGGVVGIRIIVTAAGSDDEEQNDDRRSQQRAHVLSVCDCREKGDRGDNRTTIDIRATGRVKAEHGYMPYATQRAIVLGEHREETMMRMPKTTLWVLIAIGIGGGLAACGGGDNGSNGPPP